MARQDIVAMILAGGRGSRLGVLTENLAKPAVPFGGRYHIIDFPLSNCTNSGIEAVGVLTQYQPLMLNTYIGNGHPWDLDRNNGGAYILPPYLGDMNNDWYKGTANAIYQNIEFVENYQPKYVLILSGDHVYKMNYRELLQTHINKNADATIAVIEVPWEDASRFGLLITDGDDKVTQFEEKPKNPSTNLASMGIYIFTWEKLKKILEQDEKNSKSEHDFGNDILPKMLGEYNIFAHRYRGYWKDVGTILALWESNLDILDKPEELCLSDSLWRVYSRNPVKPSHYISKEASVQNSALTDGDIIYGEVEHSILSNSVIVEKGAVVKDSIIMPGAIIKKGAYLERCIVGIGTIIGEKVIACPNQKDAIETYIDKKNCAQGITVFDKGLKIKNGVKIQGESMIGRPKNNKKTSDVVESFFRTSI